MHLLCLLLLFPPPFIFLLLVLQLLLACTVSIPQKLKLSTNFAAKKNKNPYGLKIKQNVSWTEMNTFFRSLFGTQAMPKIPQFKGNPFLRDQTGVLRHLLFAHSSFRFHCQIWDRFRCFVNSACHCSDSLCEGRAIEGFVGFLCV